MSAGDGQEEYAELPAALGLVLDADRGALPFALIHGEPLVAAAAWALGEAGVTLVDATVAWDGLAGADEPLVLHDPLCPMTPPDFIAACVGRAVAADGVVVGVRPVTDTVKEIADGMIGDTLDRDALVAVASPIALPASVVAALDGLPSVDPVALVGALRERFEIELVEAPPAGRRVGSADDVLLLEALTAP